MFKFLIKDGNRDYTLSSEVELAIKKADGTFVVIPCSVSGSTATVTLTEQALTVPGVTLGEVRILSEGTVLTSTQFDFFVRENIINDQAIQSTSEYKELDNLLQEAQTVTQELVTARETLANTDALQEEIAGLNAVTQGLINTLEEKQTEVGNLAQIITEKVTETETAITNLENISPEIEELKTLVTQAQTVNQALSTLTETVNSANQVDGAIKSKVQIIEGWIANPEQFKGDTGEPATVTNTSVDGQGNTTITFNDGTIVTVQKGADGTMTFADLTQEQKDSLKGDQGEQGPKGDKGEPGDPASNLVTSVNGQIGEVIVTDTTYSAGTNVTITGTTISATDTIYDDAALETRITAVENREDKDTTYDVATTTTDGLMSSTDKTKLDGVETGAEKNSVTSVQGRTGTVTINKSDVGLGSVNNVAITAAQVTKINELNYTRAMTEAAYNALSQAEKDRLDVWYGIYEE